MNNSKNQLKVDKNFEKALLNALAEYHGKITEDSCIYKPDYINCEKQLQSTYSKIHRLLNKKNQKLINEYDTLKNEAFGYEADEIYLDGLKDAIQILKILEVI